MTGYPSAPAVTDPETYALPAINNEDYWRAHALGIRAIAYVLADNSQQLSSAHEFTAYALEEQAEKSDLRAELERLMLLCNTDPLTGIHNRRGVKQSYEALISSGNQQAERRKKPSLPDDAHMLLVDVDNFKQVNDRYGHRAGDDVLVRIAAAMVSNMRSNDILGRWGGDEFIAILAGAPKERAEQVAQAIRQAVQDTTSTTVSIGIGSIDYSKSLADITEHADKALSTAKTDRKNTVVNFDDLQA